MVFITASYGLGETVVQGAVNPDEFYVHKPTLEAGPSRDPAAYPGQQGCIKMVYGDESSTGKSVKTVEVRRGRPQALLHHRRGRRASWPARPLTIEKHYGRPMDIEWGKDGETDGSTSCRPARRR
ncbi:MAG: PEP/pyruvate-binding domain-containing protein [Arhodomonas sp.]|nr:PEP/pyruvate-binding domain-containing protein [Arhodomonas sp.]